MNKQEVQELLGSRYESCKEQLGEGMYYVFSVMKAGRVQTQRAGELRTEIFPKYALRSLVEAGEARIEQGEFLPVFKSHKSREKLGDVVKVWEEGESVKVAIRSDEPLDEDFGAVSVETLEQVVGDTVEHVKDFTGVAMCVKGTQAVPAAIFEQKAAAGVAGVKEAKVLNNRMEEKFTVENIKKFIKDGAYQPSQFFDEGDIFGQVVEKDGLKQFGQGGDPRFRDIANGVVVASQARVEELSRKYQADYEAKVKDLERAEMTKELLPGVLELAKEKDTKFGKFLGLKIEPKDLDAGLSREENVKNCFDKYSRDWEIVKKFASISDDNPVKPTVASEDETQKTLTPDDFNLEF